RRVLDDQVKAWNRGDLEGFMAGYWKSPELTFSSGGDQTKGWQATFDRYRKRYQTGGAEMGTLSFSGLAIDPPRPGSAFGARAWPAPSWAGAGSSCAARTAPAESSRSSSVVSPRAGASSTTTLPTEASLCLRVHERNRPPIA